LAKVKESIKLLEIGVMNGMTAFPLCTNLSEMNINYTYDAVDIFVREHVKERLSYTFCLIDKLNLHEENSLTFLSNRISNKNVDSYDIILIDGDHNYETVSKECKMIQDLISDDTVVIFDDFHNKHAEEDSYYYHMKGYENNKLATKPSKKKHDKKGVRPAVEEFIYNTNSICVHLPWSGPIMTFGRDNKVMFPILFEGYKRGTPLYKYILKQIKEQDL